MRSMIGLIAAGQELAERTGKAFAWLPPLVARVGIGWVFVQSGWGKLHNLERVTEFFASLGIPAPGAQAAFVSAVELVCGSLILIGLFTRFAAVPLIATMVVALLTALRDQIDSLGSLFGLSECLYIVAFLYLATSGPGPISLDMLLSSIGLRRDTPAMMKGSALRATA
jgi:putative oxidoreductase